MMNQCNLVELFSGIGSQARALKNLNIHVNTLGSSEWDVHAIAAYDLIHNDEAIPEHIANMSKEDLLQILKRYTFSNTGKTAIKYGSLKTYSLQVLQRIYTSIVRNNNFVDISTLSGEEMPNGIDILTYSFPCQDLSNVGAFHGYNKGIDKESGSRSSLLWQVGRILKEMKLSGKKLPRYLLMENVPTLLSKRHFKNFSIWLNELNELGYINKYFRLNANAFGLPQNRPRLLMVSVLVEDDLLKKNLVQNYLDSKDEAAVILDYHRSKFYKNYSVQELLRTDYSNEILFEEAVDCTPNNTVSRQKIWDENPQIVLPGNAFNEAITCVRTITTKQDRHPNSGNLYFDSGIEGRAKFRYLTPRECMLFMGFTDRDYIALKNNSLEFHRGDSLLTRDKIIHMAGNSIPVKLLEGIFFQITQIDDLLTKYEREVKKGRFQIDNEKEYSKKIKSFLLAKGISLRHTENSYPQNANLICPQYNTAIFIRPCRLHGPQCINKQLVNKNMTLWMDIDDYSPSSFECDVKTAVSIGWNAIILWECQINQDRFDETMLWLEQTIRESQNKELGRVLSLD